MRIGTLPVLLLPALVLGVPPGTPMSDFGPSQVSMGLYFDHSGQDLFQEAYPSVLNTTGLAVEYAPWPYLAVGAFAGGAEFDIDVPPGRENDTSLTGFNTGLSFYGGGTLKLATPRFVSGSLRLAAYGTAGYLDAEDEHRNRKRGILAHSGGSVQWLAWGKVNFVLGGEFQAVLEGEQTSSVNPDPIPMGLSEPSGPVDYMRGLVGVEYFFKGKNRPFISVAVRPTGAIGWHDHLGLRNASVSVSLGAIATLPSKAKDYGGDEDEEPDFVED